MPASGKQARKARLATVMNCVSNGSMSCAGVRQNFQRFEVAGDM